MKAINSQEALLALTKGQNVLWAEYTFNNPESINGPFGSFTLIIIEESGQYYSSGEMNIRTLFGLGSSTTLYFTGTADFNGSTGITTVNANGYGIVSIPLQGDYPVIEEVEIQLNPGFKTGTVGSGFGGLPCKVSKMIIPAGK